MKAGDSRLGVVVLTHNRREELLQTLDRLSDLPERPRVLVVDNASMDGTTAAVSLRFPELEYLRLERNIGAAARNLGLVRLDRRYVALCDDDTWWEPHALSRAADILDAHPRLAVVTARVLIGPECRPDPTSEEMARSPLQGDPGVPGKPLLGFLAGASVVRRDALLAAGAFEPRFFLGGEEELLALDLETAGWRMTYVEDLVVHHHPSAIRDAAGRRRLLLRNRLWVAWLRRPARVAVASTAALANRSLVDPDARRAFLQALCGARWTLRRRRVVPENVEQRIKLLEAQKRQGRRRLARPGLPPSGTGRKVRQLSLKH